jgi:hypothetical protein
VIVSNTETFFKLVNHWDNLWRFLNDCFAFELGCLGDNKQVGDWYCDDETNTEACNFDGGDCCSGQSYYINCVLCYCHETGMRWTASAGGTQV